MTNQRGSSPDLRIKSNLINKLTTAERQNFLDSFEVVFCDCDGVMWHMLREPIPGSAEAIDYLRKRGKQVTFVTNNTIEPIEKLLEKFASCNTKVDRSDIVHPAQTVCDYLRAINFDGLIFCIASKVFKNLLRAAGFQLVEEKDRIISESVHNLRSAIYNKDPVKAVIIDVDLDLTVAKLMRAHVHLKDPDCLFIGGAADMLIPFGDGEVIGPGPFITIVENSTKRTATILGKPGKELSQILKERHRLVDTRRALFIGDSLGSDIKFGKMSGFQTLLVLSGGAKMHDLASDLPDDEVPDFVVESLGDINNIV